jgi:hypothetical protein
VVVKKLLLLLLSFSGVFLFSFNANAQQLGMNTLADQFAIQAGTIAGTVQACGQSVLEYGSRVVEAVNVLAATPQERMGAMTVYQRALANAQTAETHTHSINCSDAMKSFNALPLMQPDYKKTVLPQLGQMVAQPAMAAPPTSSLPMTTQASPVMPATLPPAATDKGINNVSNY